MKLTRKNIDFEVKEVTEDDDYFYFEGYGSTFDNEDRVGDIMVRGCFLNSLSMHGMPMLLWQHRQDEPVGIYTEAKEDSQGLFLKGKMPKADSLVGGRIMPQMKVGSVKTLSIGFTVDQGGSEWKDGIRLLKKVTLWEVSLVTIPANPKAIITGVKAVKPSKSFDMAPDDTPWDEQAAIGRIREATGSTEAPSSSYRKAFLWFNEEKADDFDSYMMPFADVIDGDMMAVPKAIMACAEMMSGEGSMPDGMALPAEEMDAMRSVIGLYYEKMGKQAPWDEDDSEEGKMLDAEALKSVTTKRQLEDLLRSTSRVSKHAAVAIASLSNLRDEPGSLAAILSELKSLRGKIG